MSDTPRTDAEIDRENAIEGLGRDRHDDYCEMIDFARQLEHELTEARAEAELADDLSRTLGGLLERTINAIKGDPGPLRAWCTHDTPEQAERVVAERDRLRDGITAVACLIADSEGVYGLHLNGDPAPWGELRPGGQFQDWLADFDKAEAMLDEGGAA